MNWDSILDKYNCGGEVTNQETLWEYRFKNKGSWICLQYVTFPKGASTLAQGQRICLPMQEAWVRSLGQEDPLVKEMATHSSILAWEISWTEEPGGLQSMGSERIGHDL